MEEVQSNLCARVRESAQLIMHSASHVKFNHEKLTQFIQSLEIVDYTSWSECHFDHAEIPL